MPLLAPDRLAVTNERSSLSCHRWRVAVRGRVTGAGVKAPVAFQFFPLRYELYTIVIIALPSALTTFSIILNVTLASR